MTHSYIASKFVPNNVSPGSSVTVHGAERSQSSGRAQNFRELIFQFEKSAEENLSSQTSVLQQVVSLDGFQHGLQQQKFAWNKCFQNALKQFTRTKIQCLSI